MKHDWTAARLEYITSTVTLKELAIRHQVSFDAVRKRAEIEHWSKQRLERQQFMMQEASQQLAFDAVAELHRQNLVDIDCARQLREHIVRLLAELKGDDLSPADVRALAGALESTQRVCRLALGASTSNEIVVKPETPEIDLSKLDDQEFETFKRLMEKAGVPPIRGVKPPGGLQ